MCQGRKNQIINHFRRTKEIPKNPQKAKEENPERTIIHRSTGENQMTKHLTEQEREREHTHKRKSTKSAAKKGRETKRPRKQGR